MGDDSNPGPSWPPNLSASYRKSAMRLRTLAIAGITGTAVLALVLADGGVADARKLASIQVFFGQAQGRTPLGGCGVDFRAWADDNPDRPGSITLNPQGLNTYGPDGCGGWVAIRWARPSGLRIDWFTECGRCTRGPTGACSRRWDLPPVLGGCCWISTARRTAPPTNPVMRRPSTCPEFRTRTVSEITGLRRLAGQDRGLGTCG